MANYPLAFAQKYKLTCLCQYLLCFFRLYVATIRLAEIPTLLVIFIFTHDSVAVGEDDLTHQPIKKLMSFRTMPNVNAFRPADANETFAAWQLTHLSQNTPSLLVLTRQNLPTLDTANNTNIFKGGYIIAHEKGNNPEGILLATGSEVYLAISAQKNWHMQILICA